MANELKQKLDQVEADLRGLREDKATAGRKREEAKEKYAEVIALGDEAPEGAEAEARASAMECNRDWGTASDKIEVAHEQRSDLLKLLGDAEADQRQNGNGNGSQPFSPQPSPAGHEGVGGPIEGWDSSRAFADDAIRKQLEFLATSKARFGSVELGQVASRDVMVADVGVSKKMRDGAYRGIVPYLYRSLSFLALIPVGTTDGNTVPYTQENVVTGEALETAEGGLKPEAGMTWTDAESPVATIAAWMKTRKQVLSDFGALRSTIDTRLRYLVQLRLEKQVLKGDGSGVNLRGILNTPGIGQVAYNANVPFAELVLSGITNIFLNEGAADGVVLHPIDWQTALTQKAHFGGGTGAAGTAGSYEYIGGGPFGSTPQTLWGVRAIPSAALTQGQGVVADFGLGTQLLIREGVNVLFSDSDQDDFIRNRVTILAEMRAAMLVWRPSVVQEIDLSA